MSQKRGTPVRSWPGRAATRPTVPRWKPTKHEGIQPNAGKRTDPRPNYIQLGEDTGGPSHVYRTNDETIQIAQDGERVQRFFLGTRTVDDCLNFVRDDVEGREWENRSYIPDDEYLLAALIEDTATEVAT